MQMRPAVARSLGLISAPIAKAFAFLTQSSKRVLFVWSLIVLFLIACLDYFTTVEMSLAAFYWIPVALMTWYHGARMGYLFAALSVAFEIGTDIIGGVAHSHPFFLLWDIGMRFLSLAIFVLMLETIKRFNQEAKRSAELQLQLESSRAAYRELCSFSYIISHNLRAPLRAIIGYSQIANESYATQLDEQGREYLKALEQSGQTMTHLIDALLALIEFSGGDLHREKFDLSAVAESVAKDLQKEQPRQDVKLSVESGITVFGDQRLIRMAMQCLMENAWKFTRKCTAPTIAFGQTRREGHQVYFVRDNGIGFNMAYANKLFMPFQTVHKPGEFEGVGIGLPIAERIIRRHGGSIWAEGTEGRGATFYFALEHSASSN
jgi:signal transduction histidine kinase